MPNASAFWFERALRFVGAGRLLLATGGLGIQSYFVWYLQIASNEAMGAAFAYWCFSLVAYLTSVFSSQSRRLQAAAAICGDLIACVVLHTSVAQRLGGANTMLYVWPVIESAVLGSSVLASVVTVGFTVFSVALTVSREGGFYPDATMAVLIFAALGMLVVGALLHSLVTRLAQQEWESSEAQRLSLRSQMVARLALAKLEDGMMVITRDGRLDFANPTALSLLGIKDQQLPQTLSDRLALRPLLDGVTRLVNGGADEELRLRWDAGLPTDVLVSVQVERVAEEDAVIVLLRSAGELEVRLHQAKLASMGRLVAAIAHEVRNPLSAVTQAAELLREKAERSDARLLDLILTNSGRINETIQDILTLGRRGLPDEPASLQSYDLKAWTQDWLEERRLLSEHPARLRASLTLERFDTQFPAEQLRRVLNNLLENAERYASREAGAIWIKLEQGAQAVELVLGNDGQPIELGLRSSLFEPFVSTEARGTGLGLFISHELCASNFANLNYRIAHSGFGEFVISFDARKS